MQVGKEVMRTENQEKIVRKIRTMGGAEAAQSFMENEKLPPEARPRYALNILMEAVSIADVTDEFIYTVWKQYIEKEEMWNQLGGQKKLMETVGYEFNIRPRLQNYERTSKRHQAEYKKLEQV